MCVCVWVDGWVCGCVWVLYVYVKALLKALEYMSVRFNDNVMDVVKVVMF